MGGIFYDQLVLKMTLYQVFAPFCYGADGNVSERNSRRGKRQRDTSATSRQRDGSGKENGQEMFKKARKENDRGGQTSNDRVGAEAVSSTFQRRWKRGKANRSRAAPYLVKRSTRGRATEESSCEVDMDVESQEEFSCPMDYQVEDHDAGGKDEEFIDALAQALSALSLCVGREEALQSTDDPMETNDALGNTDYVRRGRKRVPRLQRLYPRCH